MKKPRKYIKSTRNYDDPQYKKLRAEVRRRDNYRCQFPDCRCKNRRLLETHHILSWASFPSLRYEVSNAILLCKRHHKLVTGKEIYYAKMFIQIIKSKRK